jgi:dihydropteroate synthase
MFTLNCKGKLLTVDKPLVMGIINATPDSFYEGSRFSGTDKILSRAEKMIVEGADIIDIGGQSTRPGSEAVSEGEELKRVIDGIEAIHHHFPNAVISIDTYYAVVAKKSIQAGASIVNDISAGDIDKQMIPTVAALQTPYIAMHMKGTPATMQQYLKYDNLIREVVDFFIRKKDDCKKAGIHDVIIDPGFGFSKKINQNLELLKNLSAFKILDAPILVGVSRKSSVYKTLGITAGEALNGTTVLNTIALINGANILRVHDVKEAKEVIKLWSMVRESSNQ